MKNSIIIFLICTAQLASAQILKPVKWAYGAKKISKTEALVFIKATIDKGWHIYSVNQRDGGPIKTSFEFTPSKDFQLVGGLVEPTPHKSFNETFKMDVLEFTGQVIFRQRVKLLAGSTVVKGKVSFMTCDDHQCLPPDEVLFSIPIK